jgi:hypothetical protein
MPSLYTPMSRPILNLTQNLSSNSCEGLVQEPKFGKPNEVQVNDSQNEDTINGFFGGDGDVKNLPKYLYIDPLDD